MKMKDQRSLYDQRGHIKLIPLQGIWNHTHSKCAPTLMLYLLALRSERIALQVNKEMQYVLEVYCQIQVQALQQQLHQWGSKSHRQVIYLFVHESVDVY